MKYSVDSTPKPKALVVHCVDPRFAVQTGEFIKSELSLNAGDYALLSVPGGIVSALLSDDAHNHERKYVTESIEFILTHFTTIDRVVLIAHEACGKYKALGKTLSDFSCDGEEMINKQKADLKSAESIMSELAKREIPNVEFYILKFANPEKTEATFERV
jgi:carbonic anhydrase